MYILTHAVEEVEVCIEVIDVCELDDMYVVTT